MTSAAFFDVRDGAVLVEFPEASDEEANRASVALGARLRADRGGGVHDAIPGARSLLIVFDPLRLSSARLRDEVGRRLGAASDSRRDSGTRTLTVPVVYDGADLDELARAAGMPSLELARRHASGEYRVAFLGFAPGFAYLTGLAPELHAPRLRVPRTRVPAGSVAIGGPYTGVYPAASPGGWRLIGRTSLRLLDPAADPPSLLAAGDRVRFASVRAEDLRPPPPTPRTEPRDNLEPILRVLSPGVAATVQGGAGSSRGFGSSGIPPGGAADPLALARANALAGNAAGVPGLEMGLVGCEIEILEPAVVALGGSVEAQWNGRPAPLEAALEAAAGDRLRIGRVRAGVWAYLAVRGGLEPPARFAPQRRLAAGEVLMRHGAPEAAASSSLRESAAPETGELTLRVLPGPEAGAFAPSELGRFFAGAWRVSADCDRRGIRLEGLEGLEGREGAAPLAHRAAPEIPPSGTVPGTIQVPGGGFPIVLGPDGPVTGGYPRIATVIGADVPILGLAAPGTVLRFARVGLKEALRARRSSSAGVS